MRPNNPIIQDPDIEDSVWKDSFSENPTWINYINENPISNTNYINENPISDIYYTNENPISDIYYTNYITGTSNTVPKDECCLKRLNTRWCFILALFSFVISGVIFYILFFCNNC